MKQKNSFDQLTNQDGTFCLLAQFDMSDQPSGFSKEFEAFCRLHIEKTCYLIFLQIPNTKRAFHPYVTEKSGVKHESPQALVFSGGKVKWHASHSSITKEALEHNL
ncbi:thioredoxin family protein [Bacillus pumilus]|nr:thioredoxin family protein [Bacillus pumilus]WOP23223.1 thioredoxin family protein [Bacillus pumilus]